MKKIAIRVTLALLGLVALLVLALVVKFYVLSPALRPAPDMKATGTPEAVEHGKYLVNHVTGCLGCHSKIDETKPGDFFIPGTEGGGRDFGALPNVPIHIRAANITPDKDTGIGNWTDGEIVRAVREGVSRDGRPLFPQMPYQTYRETLSDDDALAIVSYLRTLKPIANRPGQTEVKFPISMFIRAVPKPLEKAPPPAPPVTDKLARGKWLLKVASCGDCHDSHNEKMEPIPGKELAGGTRFPLPGDKYVYVPNITSDKATGIGAYSDDDLRRVFEEGKGKDGRDLYMMPWSYYRGMTPEDKDALYFALRQVPPVANVVLPSKTK
jgi:cytochrome c553